MCEWMSLIELMIEWLTLDEVSFWFLSERLLQLDELLLWLVAK